MYGTQRSADLLHWQLQKVETNIILLQLHKLGTLLIPHQQLEVGVIIIHLA